MKRRPFLAAAAALAVAPRLVRAAAMRAFGGELVAAVLEPAKPALDRGNPRTLDPFAARTRLERELARALHLPLASLVSASPSGRNTWTFTLRPGLTFSDGSPVQAADALASLARLPGGIANALEIESSEARGGGPSFTITTRRPMPSLPAMLASFEVPLASAAPGDAVFGPLGLGPFAASAGAAGRPGTDIVFAANARCPAGRAFVDRLVLTPIPDGPALATALRKGQIHVAAAQSTAAEVSGAKLVKRDAAATLVLAIGARVQGSLRQRIASAPDRKVLAEVFLNERVRPASTVLPPALLGSLSAGPIPAAAPQKGSKTPLSLFVSNASAEIADVAARLVWDLQAADIQATIGWRHPSDIDSEPARARADLVLFEWVPAATDPGWALAAEPQFRPIVDARLPEDADARAVVARGLDESLRAGSVLVPIAHPVRLLRGISRVDGLVIDALGRISWADVSLRRGAP